MGPDETVGVGNPVDLWTSFPEKSYWELVVESMVS